MGLISEDSSPGNWPEVIPGAGKAAQGQVYPQGKIFAEHYQIEKVIGRGALGVVYLATDLRDGNAVSLKIFRKEILASGRERQRFERFLNLAQELKHPGLVAISGHGCVSDEFFMAREFIRGRSLDQLILEKKKLKGSSNDPANKAGTFPIQEVIPLLSKIGETLGAVETKTFHGSLSPTDILIAGDSVKVANIALARIFQPAQFSSFEIFYGNGYYYLAPEYDRAGSIIDHRADLYALAVIAYEMLTGEIPRTPITPPSLANSDIFAGLDGPFLKALDPNPASRQENIIRFISQIQALSGLNQEMPEPPKAADEEPSSISSVVLRSQLEATAEPLPAPATELLLTSEEDSAKVPATAKERLSDAIGQQLQARLTHIAKVTPKVTKAPFLPVGGNKFAQASRVIARSSAMMSDPAEIPMSMGKRMAVFAVLVAMLGLSAWVIWHFLSDRFEKGENNSAAQGDLSPQGDNASGEKAASSNINSVAITPAVTHNSALKAATSQSMGGGEHSAADGSEKKAFTKPPTHAKALVLAQTLNAKKKVCPEGMTFVPGGAFVLGSHSADRDFLDFKAHSVRVLEFCVDTFEFPNAAGRPPKTQVPFAEAERACDAEGKRLCTETEWERACKGPNDAEFPYGNAFALGRCNTKKVGAAGLALSGHHAACANSWGVYDMSGNAAEWTSSLMSRGKSDRIIRGGSFNTSDWASRCTSRKNRLPNAAQKDLGFRCCMSPRY